MTLTRRCQTTILDLFEGRQPRKEKEIMKYLVDTSVLIHSLISRPKLSHRAP